MKAEFLSLSDGVRITIEIIKTRSKLYNRYTFYAFGREPFSGKVPKDWNCENILRYWWRGDCKIEHTLRMEEAR